MEIRPTLKNIITIASIVIVGAYLGFILAQHYLKPPKSPIDDTSENHVIPLSNFL